MDNKSFFKIGFIHKTHGLKGEVTISLDADAPADLATITSVFVASEKGLVPYFIHSISMRGPKGFVRFEDIESIEEASKLVKKAIYLPKSARPESGVNTFYDDEVIGYTVLDTASGPLGTISGVMQAGPNRLLVLDHDGKEILIPVTGPFITGINKEIKRIDVDLPEGFLAI